MTEQEFLGFHICRLTPYSYMLNPIECIWSAVKADIKQFIRQNHNKLLRGDPDGMQTQKEFRLRFLERTEDSALKIVPAQMCFHSVTMCQDIFLG